MLRLVTQFDDHRREVTPATPTCCCCCCCIVSIATSMTYSGVDVATRKPPAGPDMSRSDRIAFAVLALPIGVLVGTILGSVVGVAGSGDEDAATVAFWIGVAGMLLTWGTALTLAYRPILGEKALGRAAAIVVATTASFLVEIPLVFGLAVSIIGIPVYFVALVLVPVQVNKRLRQRRADDQRWGA